MEYYRFSGKKMPPHRDSTKGRKPAASLSNAALRASNARQLTKKSLWYGIAITQKNAKKKELSENLFSRQVLFSVRDFFQGKKMATPQRFELRLNEPKSFVLPLHHRVALYHNVIHILKKSTYQNKKSTFFLRLPAAGVDFCSKAGYFK